MKIKKKLIEKNRTDNKTTILVILIIVLIIINIFSYLYFFKTFNLKIFNFKDSETEETDTKCEDGTPNEECSREKPFYCYNKQLIKKAFTCGCPEDYNIDFQDCKKI